LERLQEDRKEAQRAMNNILGEVLGKILLGVVRQMEPGMRESLDKGEVPLPVGIFLFMGIAGLIMLIYQYLQAIEIL
jgi:hypothetical protein